MATIEEPRAAAEPFIRPDGKEKVTGVGRYTADLNLTGQLHAKFRYADETHARITRIDVSKARALPGVIAVLTHEDVPEVKYGGMVQDRYLFAKDKVVWEGDVIAGVAALTPEIAEQAAALIEVDYEPLPPITDFEAATGEGAPLVHDDWETDEGDDSMGRDGNRIGYSTIVKGDADAAMAGADVVVKGRYVADCSQGVPIEPRAVIAQWTGRQGHDLDVDAGAVCGPLRRRARAADPGVARPDHRAAPRRRLRREVRLPLRGSRRRARAGREASREARLLPPRGVRRRRPPARGHGHRARDRREARTARSSRAAAGSCSTRAPTAARAASSRRWPRCTPAARTRSRTSTSSRR